MELDGDLWMWILIESLGCDLLAFCGWLQSNASVAALRWSTEYVGSIRSSKSNWAIAASSYSKA